MTSDCMLLMYKQNVCLPGWGLSPFYSTCQSVHSVKPCHFEYHLLPEGANSTAVQSYSNYSIKIYNA